MQTIYLGYSFLRRCFFWFTFSKHSYIKQIQVFPVGGVASRVSRLKPATQLTKEVHEEANKKYVEHHLSPFQYASITDKWEGSDAPKVLSDAFREWCSQMRHAMDAVLPRGIRCVPGQIPPAAKPGGAGQNEDLWPLCPMAAYRTKKPMNGKASLLAGTKESGYAGEISLGVLMKMLEDRFATPAAIDPRVIIKAKSLEERSRLIHDLAQSCARAMEPLMQEELKDYLSHPCTDDGCFLRRYFPTLSHCCHDTKCNHLPWIR